MGAACEIDTLAKVSTATAKAKAVRFIAFLLGRERMFAERTALQQDGGSAAVNYQNDEQTVRFSKFAETKQRNRLLIRASAAPPVPSVQTERHPIKFAHLPKLGQAPHDVA
jgi:hypothetical protein